MINGIRTTRKKLLWVELIELIDGKTKLHNCIYTSSWKSSYCCSVDDDDYITVTKKNGVKIKMFYDNVTLQEIEHHIEKIKGGL